MSIFTPTRRPCQFYSDTTGKCREAAQPLLCMTFANILQGTFSGKVVVVNPGPAKNRLWRQEQERQKQIRAEAEAQQREILSVDERDILYLTLNQLALNLPID